MLPSVTVDLFELFKVGTNDNTVDFQRRLSRIFVIYFDLRENERIAFVAEMQGGKLCNSRVGPLDVWSKKVGIATVLGLLCHLNGMTKFTQGVTTL